MAEKTGTPLSTVAGFSRDALTRLESAWITTAEELVSVAKLPNGKAGLAEVLAMNEDDVGSLVDAASEALPAHAKSFDMDEEEYPTGALDEPEGLLGARDVEFGVEELPESIDLHDRLPPPRDQGGRSTCVAFSSVAAREFLLGPNQGADLSEQFLYWACKERDLYPGEGTKIKVAMEVLAGVGVCPEAGWPYNPVLLPGNEGHGPPPAAAPGLATSYKITSWTPLNATDTLTLRAALAAGQLVVFGATVFSYWSHQPVRVTGDVRLPLSSDLSRGGHAMCLVGYEGDDSVPGGGYFIVRNSWGQDWAQGSKIAPGYCRLPYRYLELYGKAAYTFC